jgi:hypothetical protein
MYPHGPSVLQGPVSQQRPWWAGNESALACDEPPVPEPSDHTGAKRPADAPIRTELVERIRREIANGTYETPDKWEVALDRLLDSLEGE